MDKSLHSRDDTNDDKNLEKKGGMLLTTIEDCVDGSIQVLVK